MEHVFLIRRDGKPVGICEASPAVGPLAWFHRECGGYSASHAVEHEGYSFDDLGEDGLDCHDVADVLEGIAARCGLSVTWQFVPFSQSRNAKPSPLSGGKPWQSLNWKATIHRAGMAATVPVIHSIDYSQGVAYAPAYKRDGDAWGKQRAIEGECQTGTRWLFGVTPSGAGPRDTHKPIDPPRFGDLLQSIAMDASAIDEGSFEAWASSYGYDTDSISARDAYDECLKRALEFRAAVGPHAFEEFRLAARFN